MGGWEGMERVRTASLPRLVAALLWILVVGCTPTARDRTSPTRPAPAPAASAPVGSQSPGCRTETPPPRSPPAHPAASPPDRGVVTRQLDVAGNTRTYLLALPSSYSSARPAPLILNFHGFGSNAVQQAAYSRLNDLGPERGFLVVTPQGSGSPARWALPDAIPGVDEVAFVRALLNELHGLWCIDEKRIYATGMSNGAAFSALLACRLEGRIAAVAPVAGINLVEPCDSPAPLSVIAFHGAADPVVPYEGGLIAGSFVVRSVPDAVAEWATHGRCDPYGDEVRIGTGVRLRAYDPCPGGIAVRLYTVEGGGHTWPGAPALPALGRATQEIDASQLLLDFFTERLGTGPLAILQPAAPALEPR